MTVPITFRPSREVFNPVLADEALIGAEGTSTCVFYTPSARWIERHLELIIAAGSGACLLTAWLLSWVHAAPPLCNLFVLLAFAIAGSSALREVWSKLHRWQIDIDLLMLLGAVLAAWIGSPFEGALLLFLFALSGALEGFALRRTQAAITALRDLAPLEATLLEGESMRRVSLRQVAIGAVILVKPGEKVPLDGVVIQGSSALDESAITGESVPRDCAAGDLVFAGAQNLNGRLEVRVTKLAADTTLARIVQLVTQARHQPAAAQRLIDRIGPKYSVVVIAAVIAVVPAALLLGLTWSEALRRGIALLIVASPCALIIATPVAYLSAIAGAARRGVLIKGGAHLEIAARASVVAFDKTGTLTTGRLRLVDIDAYGDLGKEETLRFAAALESSSTHPLALAVQRALKELSLPVIPVRDYRSIPGEGAVGVVDGRKVWIGRPEMIPRYAPQADHRYAERLEQFRREGKTVSAIVVDGIVGLLTFQDTPRQGSAGCVKRLHAQGIRRIDMLTGDHEIVARRVSADLKLDGYQADLVPEGKVDALRELKQRYGTLILVGDGINDAPALAHADVGIAMGAMGAEIALEAADIVLMTDHIEGVAWVHRHALRTARVVRQNLTAAIAVIAGLSVFAVLGEIPLPLAVIGHEGSTVLVALNGLRLLRADRE